MDIRHQHVANSFSRSVAFFSSSNQADFSCLLINVPRLLDTLYVACHCHHHLLLVLVLLPDYYLQQINHFV